MIPSMDFFGGWGPFLGFRDRNVPDKRTVGNLRKSSQRFPDTLVMDPASYLRDPLLDFQYIQSPLYEVDANLRKRLTTTVGLIGGGIANLIALYELSRCGVKATVIDQKGWQDPAKKDKPLVGGRIVSDVSADGFAAELGAGAFPNRSPLLWHYVWRTAVANGFTEDEADRLEAERLPSPGLVPTAVCFQDTWFYPSTNLTTLPRAVRQAAQLFRAWLLGLNDGAPAPDTVDLRIAMTQAKQVYGTGKYSTELETFWTEMRRRYDGRSFGSVLGTEVFAKGTSPAVLHAAFGAVGVGTGGFGPVYDVACLEVLRHVIWDYDALYRLPSIRKGDASGETSGVQGTLMTDFLQDFAGAALQEAQCWTPDRAITDLFMCGSPVSALAAQEDGRTKVILEDQTTKSFDLTIIAISSRAMQALGLDHDKRSNPLNTTAMEPDVATVLRSVQAGVHRLNMSSSYKAFARIPLPERVSNWPQDDGRNWLRCFVTDRYPRLTYVMPQQRPEQQDVMIVAADTWGNDAMKFDDAEPAERQARIAGAFSAQDDDNGVTGGDRYRPVGASIAASKDFRDRRWTQEPGFGGGVKLDLPADEYFSASLFYHSQLATRDGIEDNTQGRTFLAGDSVGRLGGWAEGTATSALTATTAVLFQIRKLVGQVDQAKVRSYDLINPRSFKFHSYTDITVDLAAPLGRRQLTGVADWRDPERRPPTWRWDEVANSDDPMETMTFAQSGRWRVGHPFFASRGFSFFNPGNQQWSPFKGFNGDVPPLRQIRISASPPTPTEVAGVAQMVALTAAGGHVLHCTSADPTFRQTDCPSAVDAAIAVVDSGWAHVVSASPTANRQLNKLWWGRRDPGGAWTDFVEIAYGLSVEKVAITNCPTTEYIVVSMVTDAGEVFVKGYDAVNQTWTSWMEAKPPAQNLRADRITMVGVPYTVGRVRLVAMFDDGNAYHRLFEVAGQRNQYLWRKLPYPASHGGEFDTVHVSVGAAVAACDPVSSVVVSTTDREPGNVAEMEAGR